MIPTVATRIREQARRDPKRVALREKWLGIWQETTWAEYGDLVERAAHGLMALGVRPGDGVAIECENRPEWVVAEAATVAARAGTSERDWIVYIEPRGVRGYGDPSLVWWPDLLARGAEHRAEQPRLLDELAAEVGEDDRVTPALTAGEVNEVLASPLHPDPGPRDFVLCHLPLSETVSRLSTAWLSADAGVQLHFGEPSAGLVQTLDEVRPSLLLATPPVWEQIQAKGGKRGLRKCRSAVSTGPIAPELSEWYRGIGIEVGVA
jgi:long-chain acyl-CoA synthetase